MKNSTKNVEIQTIEGGSSYLTLAKGRSSVFRPKGKMGKKKSWRRKAAQKWG